MKEPRHTIEDRKSWGPPEGFERVADAPSLADTFPADVEIEFAAFSRSVRMIEAGAMLVGVEECSAVVSDPGADVAVIGKGHDVDRTRSLRIESALWFDGVHLKSARGEILTGYKIGPAWPEGNNPRFVIPPEGEVSERLDLLEERGIRGTPVKGAALWAKLVEVADGDVFSLADLDVMMSSASARQAAAEGAVESLFEIIENKDLPRSFISQWLAKVAEIVDVAVDGPFPLEVLREGLEAHLDGLEVSGLLAAVGSLLPSALMGDEAEG